MSEWISVKIEPVPMDTNFWFLDENLGQGNGYYDKPLEDFCIETFAGLKIRIVDKITHWQPLPLPPKEG